MKGFSFKPRLFSELQHYNREKFAADAMAGLIVGIVALPLAIAFGIASGVSPSQGILTAIIGGFIVSALGGSRVQIGGPTGAFIVIIYGIVSNPALGMSGLIVATMMAGVFLILLGAFRLGTIIKFIPYPIVVASRAVSPSPSSPRRFRNFSDSRLKVRCRATLFRSGWSISNISTPPTG